MTEPDPTGESPARAMKMALRDAGIEPDRGRLRQRARDLDAARRRGRDEGDQDRPRRGARETKLAVSSTKGATGHCFGAAGAVEAVFTTLAVVDRKAPPTINYDEPRSRTATSTTSRTRRATCPICASRCRTRSASAATTRRSSCARSRSSNRRTPRPCANQARMDRTSVVVRGDSYRPAMRLVDVGGRLVELHIRRSKRVHGHRLVRAPGPAAGARRAAARVGRPTSTTRSPCTWTWLERQLASVPEPCLGLERLQPDRAAGPPRGACPHSPDRAVGGGRARRRLHAADAARPAQPLGLVLEQGRAQLQLAARARTARRARLRRRARGLPPRRASPRRRRFWQLVERRRPDYAESKRLARRARLGAARVPSAARGRCLRGSA